MKRRTRTIATAAVLTAGALGTQTGSAHADAGAAQAAVSALRAHPGAARATDGQAFRAGPTVRDANGSTHVRLQRTIDGLPVLGGDLVVHRGLRGGWRG